MATLETRTNSKWWYGRWTENGKVVVRNLDLPIEGRRPSEAQPEGDRRYRQSRESAEVKLNQIARDALTRKHVEGLAQAIHEARTGHRLGTIPLSGLFAAWQSMPRRRTQLSAKYTAFAKGVLTRFAKFITTRHPEARDMCDVTHEMAVDFLASERARGVGGRTYNCVLSHLKGTFRHLRRQAGVADNPFDDIVSREENTIHRIPYTPEELRQILDAAKDDDFCRPLIVTGICTAMRRGDVCRLRWADVDMGQRFINVKTAKTGATVSIPMFAMVYDELSKLPREGEYCFPEQAAAYMRRPDIITDRLNGVFAAAGFTDDGSEGCDGCDGSINAAQRETLTEEEMLRRGRDSLAACTRFTRKVRGRLLEIFERYMAGVSLDGIASEMHMSKGSASNYLKRIGDVTGFPVIRGQRPENVAKADANARKRAKAQDHSHGLKRVNRRGFHAFRASWVTIALTAGVPVDLVRKVTGHTTVETVMTHYFQPGREDFRKALQTAMPSLLTGGAPTREGQMLEILERSTQKTWARDRKRLQALLGQTGPALS
ncbi:MAG: tyrosine-type recombinase/integrase [bacterium]